MTAFIIIGASGQHRVALAGHASITITNYLAAYQRRTAPPTIA